MKLWLKLFAKITGIASMAGVIGITEIKVIKPDGTFRRQFQEWLPFHLLRKDFGFSLPNIPFLTGRMVDFVALPNLVPTAGLGLITSRLGASSAAVADYVANGTGTNAAAAGDTTLQTEIADSGLSRAQGTVSQQTTTVTNDTHQVSKSFSVSGTKAITEMGLLNASSSGTLAGRNVFSAVNVISGDTYVATYKIVFAAV